MAISSDVIRGYNDTMILYLLLDQPSYGYEISRQIKTLSHEKYIIKETTLYSAFTRMEKNGYITSFQDQNTATGKRRTYYRITGKGRAYYQEKCEEWLLTQEVVEQFIRKGETEIVNAYISTAHIAGCLQISHFGHGCTFLLVVNGNEKGHIWFDGRADYSGLVPKLKDGQRISFIEWYVTFLDMEIENINESLTHSTTA